MLTKAFENTENSPTRTSHTNVPRNFLKTSIAILIVGIISATFGTRSKTSSNSGEYYRKHHREGGCPLTHPIRTLRSAVWIRLIRQTSLRLVVTTTERRRLFKLLTPNQFHLLRRKEVTPVDPHLSSRSSRSSIHAIKSNGKFLLPTILLVSIPTSQCSYRTIAASIKERSELYSL